MYSLFIAAMQHFWKNRCFQICWVNKLVLLCSQSGIVRLAVETNDPSSSTALLAGICYLCCGPILQAHVYGLSEALFLAFFLSTLLFLLSDKKSEYRSAHWLFIGFWIGILTLIRYIGVRKHY
jgi:hypothetical protein